MLTPFVTISTPSLHDVGLTSYCRVCFGSYSRGLGDLGGEKAGLIIAGHLRREILGDDLEDDSAYSIVRSPECKNSPIRRHWSEPI